MKLVKLVAVAAMLVAGAAQAGGYTSLELSSEEKRATGDDSTKYGVVVGVKVDGGMDYSLKVDTSQTEIGNGSISNGVELRAKKTLAGISAYDIKPYIGVRVGQKIQSDDNFSHYAVDYGIKFPIIGDIVFLDLGGRHRNAFDTANVMRSNRAHALVSWNLTKQDTVGVRYSQAYGDTGEEKNAIRLSYTRSF
ncbi:MAG: hypothetical protein ACOVLB_07995 [Candidatus Nanopelagicus sp.]